MAADPLKVQGVGWVFLIDSYLMYFMVLDYGYATLCLFIFIAVGLILLRYGITKEIEHYAVFTAEMFQRISKRDLGKMLHVSEADAVSWISKLVAKGKVKGHFEQESMDFVSSMAKTPDKRYRPGIALIIIDEPSKLRRFGSGMMESSSVGFIFLFSVKAGLATAIILVIAALFLGTIFFILGTGKQNWWRATTIAKSYSRISMHDLSEKMRMKEGSAKECFETFIKGGSIKGHFDKETGDFISDMVELR